jgi:acyl carrier protein phosphodiesterase
VNHLAHFKLSDGDESLLVGNFLADFTKGRLSGRYAESIETGIRLHRAVDAYTDSHPLVLASHRRFEPRYRRFGGIITDIVFDHFLARQWPQYDSRPLGCFCEEVLSSVLQHEDLLPAAGRSRAHHLHDNQAMSKYVEPEFIQRSFVYLSSRLRFDNPLDQAWDQFEHNEAALTEDFRNFFPQLQSFVAHWINDNARETRS